MWFAFKKLYLCSDEQQDIGRRPPRKCCDLLSKNCIFVLTNNFRCFPSSSSLVVICFQKIVSLFWRTTRRQNKTSKNTLWFAFKKLYLCSDEQQNKKKYEKQISCDLLSKNCIFVLTNNNVIAANVAIVVVICFQKIVSLFWRTTYGWQDIEMQTLWFAFKKLYLCSDEQQFILCASGHCVVICFQKIVSLFWRTTKLY